MLCLVSTTTLQRGTSFWAINEGESPTVLYPDITPDSFKASSGWLQKFCCSHGIRGISLQGESLSADIASVPDFRTYLLEKIAIPSIRYLMQTKRGCGGDSCHLSPLHCSLWGEAC